MSTIFTKIINGEVPSHKIAENDDYLAFLDVNPSAEGHTLVIPKKEIDYIFDIEDEELKGLITFAKKIALGIDKALDTMRTGIMVEGLMVPHAHIHLVPIYSEDQTFNLNVTLDVSDERMKELAEQIREAVVL